MGKNQHIVALDIGSSKIVGAVAEKSSEGHISIKYLQEEKHLNNVRYGIIKNVMSTQYCINQILKHLEDMVDGRITQVYMGVSGRSLHSNMKTVKRSISDCEPITKRLIDRITQETAHTSILNHDIVGIVPCTYYVDHVETTNPVGQFGSSITIRFNLIVAKSVLKLNLNRLMTFGICIKDYIVTQLAVADQILFDNERALGCMLVDMGAETTTIAIYKNNILIYLNTLPLGGRNLTRDIMIGLNVLEETAENVKKSIHSIAPGTASNVVIEGINASEASNYMNARTEEIIANINQQLVYAGVTANEIKSIVLIGGCANLIDLKKKMENSVRIKVRIGKNPTTLDIHNSDINRMEYIEVFSLLAAAAECIEDGETCVALNSVAKESMRPQSSNYSQTIRSQSEIPKSRNKHLKKAKARGKWPERLKNLLSEDDESDSVGEVVEKSSSHKSKHGTTMNEYYHSNKMIKDSESEEPKYLMKDDDCVNTKTNNLGVSFVPIFREDTFSIGNLLPSRRKKQLVFSSVFAPAEVKRSSHMLVQVYLHLPKESESVQALAQETDKNAKRRDYIPLQCKLMKGDKVDILLNIYGEALMMSEKKSVVWQGSFTKCSFDFLVPKDLDIEELSCMAMLTVNGVPAGEMRFITKVVEKPRQLNPEIFSKQYQKIFISYAHQDEPKVEQMARAYKAQGVEYFFDRHYLQPGDIFPIKIREFIDSADLFILCWSANAANSDYVDLERKRALERAYPKIKPIEKAPLRIYPMSIEPRAELPSDMRDTYNFEII